MFRTFARSWEFAKMSYRVLWYYKRLIVFPILSTLAAFIVMGYFVLPLFATGQAEAWAASFEEDPSFLANLGAYLFAFLFYFCNYFVIIFFNAGLFSCAFKAINGEEPTIAYGLNAAARRLPQILAWAFVSAIVGVILKAIENMNEKVGELVAALLGSAWTALTYFVVPVIVVEGKGPVESFKASLNTLRQSWGTALVGNFSLGMISFLVTLPVVLVFVILGMLAFQSGSTVTIIVFLAMAMIGMFLVAAFTSAADSVFKAVLYTYATGQAIPRGIDTDGLAEAFRSKKKKSYC